MKVSLFLRKKLLGQNSIEELAYNIQKNNSNVVLCRFPEYSDTLKGIIQNIKFALKNKGDVNHIYCSAGAYVTFFLRNSIVTYHDFSTIFAGKNRIKRIIARFLYICLPEFFSKKLVCISNNTKNELLELLYLKKHVNKIEVIYNGYDERLRYTPKFYNKEAPKVLHIGTVARKNLETVIHALNGTKYSLCIVGKLSEEQKKILSESNISYENYYDLTYDKIVELYKCCDVVSFPTSYEGFGMIVIEANVIGRPVISSNIEVIREVGGDSCALLSDPTSSNEFLLKLNEIDSNQEYRESLVNNGILNGQRFTLKVMNENYSLIYCEVGNKE